MRRRWAALVLGWFAGCGDTVVIDHGFVGGGDLPGNYPEPAVSRCGELPDGVSPLPGLEAAWAVIALPDAQTESDRTLEAGSMWLRLSDHGFEDCGGVFFQTFECDVPDRCHWALSIGLTAPPVVQSAHDLGALPEGQFSVATPNDAEGDIRPAGGGMLILHEVTPTCVVGELIGLDGQDGEPQSGGFVAETCQRQCIPSQMGWGC